MNSLTEGRNKRGRGDLERHGSKIEKQRKQEGRREKPRERKYQSIFHCSPSSEIVVR